MHKTLRLFLPSILLLGALWPALGAADILSDNTSNTSGGDFLATDTNWQAQRFTTDAQSYSLTAVTLRMLRDTGSGAAQVRIFSDSSGNPGAVVGTLTPPGSYSDTLADTTFTASGITLQANSTYWVVLREPLNKSVFMPGKTELGHFLRSSGRTTRVSLKYSP